METKTAIKIPLPNENEETKSADIEIAKMGISVPDKIQCITSESIYLQAARYLLDHRATQVSEGFELMIYFEGILLKIFAGWASQLN